MKNETTGAKKVNDATFPFFDVSGNGPDAGRIADEVFAGTRYIARVALNVGNGRIAYTVEARGGRIAAGFAATYIAAEEAARTVVGAAVAVLSDVREAVETLSADEDLRARADDLSADEVADLIEDARYSSEEPKPADEKPEPGAPKPAPDSPVLDLLRRNVALVGVKVRTAARYAEKAADVLRDAAFDTARNISIGASNPLSPRTEDRLEKVAHSAVSAVREYREEVARFALLSGLSSEDVEALSGVSVYSGAPLE